MGYPLTTSSFLIVYPNDQHNMNLITEHLNITGWEFYTYFPLCKHQFRVVIRNLHHSTLSIEITNTLTDLGHSVRNIEILKKNKLPLTLFFC